MITDITIEKRQRVTADKRHFSILIPSWNNLPYLQLCIRSIRQHSQFNHQLLVHINEGKDGTLEWVRSQPDIDYTYSEENIGVCYALNIAASLSATDYIVFVNDDMYMCPGWDQALMAEIDQIGHPYFFLSSTCIEPRQSHNAVIVKDFGTSIENFDEAGLLKEYQLLPFRDWQGSTWPPNIVHRDVWNMVGGYSTEFSPGMYSDPDFSMKLWKLGVRLFKGIEKSRAYHFGSVSVKRVRKNKGYYMFISKWRITQNTFSKIFLQRGKAFDGPLQEPDLSWSTKLNNLYKGWLSLFKGE